MSENLGSTPTPPDFLKEVDRLVSPAYVECFTDETRKVGNLLLVVSSVLMLFVLGLVAVSPEPIRLPQLPLAITVTTGMRAMLMVLCTYFLLLFVTRSFTEWKLWRLHHQAPMTKFMDLLDRLSSSWQARTNEANKTLMSILKLLGSLTELTSEPSEMLQLQKEQDDLSGQLNGLFSEIQRKRNQFEKLSEAEQKRDLLETKEFWSEFNRLYNEHDKVYDAFVQLGDRLDRERRSRREQIAAQEEGIHRQLSQLEDIHRSQTAAPELRRLEAQIGYLIEAIRPVRKILRVRFWFEMLFPILFGALALLLGFIVHKTG